MSRTGLRTITARSTFAKGVVLLRQKWTLTGQTAKKRADYLVNLANRVLGGYHVPKVASRFEPQGNPFSAEFDNADWCVELDQRGFDQKTAPSVDDMGELADSVYHECRHAEQWFLAARLAALRGITPKRLVARDPRFRLDVAQKAQSYPVKRGSDEYKLALKIHDCLVTQQGRDRIVQTYRDLDIFIGRRPATQQAYQEAKNRLVRLGYIGPNATADQVGQAAFKAYENQFVEVDARDTGRLAKQLYCRLQRTPPPPVPRRG